MEKRRRSFLGIISLILLIWFLLFIQGRGKASNEELTLASILYFVCSASLIIYFLRGRKIIPYMPFFSVFYFISTGLVIFNQYYVFQLAEVDKELIIKVLTLTLMGFSSMLIAFYSPFNKIIETILPRIKMPLDLKRSSNTAIIIGLVGLIIFYLMYDRTIPFVLGGLIGFLAELSRLGIAILYLLKLQNKLNLRRRLIFYGMFLFRVLLDLSSGATSTVAIDFVLLFFIYIYYYQRVPWSRLIIACLVFIAVFGARDDFRSLTWFGNEYAGKRPLQKTALYIQLIRDRLTGKKERYVVEDYELLSARANYMVTFAKVVELTPAYVPYWGGYTYNSLFTTLVPRFLYPGKPQKTLGQEFGHRYELLHPNDFSTSYNLPIIVEMYINFGYLGVIVGMLILGFLFRCLYTLLNHPESGEGGIIISSLLFANYLNLESDFAITFGNTIQFIIFFYIILKFKFIKSKVDLGT